MADRLFGIPLTGDADSIAQLKRDVLEQQLRNQNISRPEYLQGVQNINAYNALQDYYANPKTATFAAGYVSPRAPETVNIDPSLSKPEFGMTTANVLAHEAGHTQELTANRRVFEDKKTQTVYETLARAAAAERAKEYKNQIQNNFKNYAENAKPSEFLGGYAKSKYVPWDERLADLQSLEAQLPRGKTLLDTPLGQSIFNTPELKQYWLESSIPLAIKAIPQSPQYQNIVFDKINQFSQLFKDEAKTTGYVQAAVKALQKAATTKVETPMYRDPFGDTTK